MDLLLKIFNMDRVESQKLLNEYVKNPALINHCQMVAKAMEFYAKKLNLDAKQVEDWYIAGLIHDIDWEMYPDEHPNYAVANIFPQHGYSQEIIEAVRAHGPERTGKFPENNIEKHLFACDELSGFINAVALIRPNKFADLTSASVIKRLKDSRFAANVSREDIYKGVELINIPIEEHITNLISCFR